MRELNNNSIERLFIIANEYLEENKIAEAKELLLEILVEEPVYADAHNLLGFIYCNHLTNLVKAERHYKLALKYEEGLPAVYKNYAHFLLNANRLDEVIEFVNANTKTIGVDIAVLLAIKGNAFEMKGFYHKALKCYKESKMIALNPFFINDINSNIDRVNLKMTRLSRAFAAF